MKIVCGKAELLAGINIALRAVPSKSTMAILESFLLTADDEICLTSNDGELAINTVVEGVVEEKGKIAVEARIFSEIVRKLPDNEVTIEADYNYKLRIICEDSEFNINGKNPDEFPDIPETENASEIEISEFTLKQLINQTIFSISPNDANQLMRGELFTIEGKNIKVTSLDSHRISMRNEVLAMAYGNEKVIVPGKTLMEISRILGGNNADTVKIIFDRKFIKFSFGATVVLSRLIEGEYFNVEQMVSADYNTSIKVNKNDFLNSIDRAITLTREGEKKPVILDINDEYMNLDITSSLGSMSARLPVKKEGKDIVIGFNPKFFVDALKVIDDEVVTIYFVNSNAPCFIRNDQVDYVYIILPVNINR